MRGIRINGGRMKSEEWRMEGERWQEKNVVISECEMQTQLSY